MTYDTAQHSPQEIPPLDPNEIELSIDVLVLTIGGVYGIGHYNHTVKTWKCFNIPFEIKSWWYLPTYSDE